MPVTSSVNLNGTLYNIGEKKIDLLFMHKAGGGGEDLVAILVQNFMMPAQRLCHSKPSSKFIELPTRSLGLLHSKDIKRFE